MVQVALAVVRRDHAAELAVAGIVEAGVGREQQQSAGLLPPADLLPAHDRLHDCVEATLRRVQIAGHVRALHLLLVTTKIRPNFKKHCHLSLCNSGGSRAGNRRSYRKKEVELKGGQRFKN
uniref:Uncharacterized protein n=1 Tax=Anopheles merus TaxID=30066 RepID=A0A182UYV4_ANOME